VGNVQPRKGPGGLKRISISQSSNRGKEPDRGGGSHKTLRLTGSGPFVNGECKKKIRTLGFVTFPEKGTVEKRRHREESRWWEHIEKQCRTDENWGENMSPEKAGTWERSQREWSKKTGREGSGFGEGRAVKPSSHDQNKTKGGKKSRQD